MVTGHTPEIEAFSDLVRLKIEHLRRFLPRSINSDVTGYIIEEIVRSFISAWIEPCRIYSGTFHNSETASGSIPQLQVDGIIYDPRAGLVILEEGNAAIVNPIYCPGVIEIKTILGSSLEVFEDRLMDIYKYYFKHTDTPHVSGVIIGHNNPESAMLKTRKGSSKCEEVVSGLCPIFILFKEQDGEYTPYYPGISSLIDNIYNHFRRA